MAPGGQNPVEIQRSIRTDSQPFGYLKCQNKKPNCGPVLGSGWQRKQIYEIIFLNHLKDKPDNAWDVSAGQDGTVMAWVVAKEGHMGHLFIGGEGDIVAKTCNTLFNGYHNLYKINFNGCFDMSQVSDMSFIFSKCSALQELDVRGFDMSNVTKTENMTKGCKNVIGLN